MKLLENKINERCLVQIKLAGRNIKVYCDFNKNMYPVGITTICKPPSPES